MCPICISSIPDVHLCPAVECVIFCVCITLFEYVYHLHMSCTICVRVLPFACVSRQLCRPYVCHVATENMEKSYFSGSNFPPHKILKSHFCPQFISKFSPKVQNSIKKFQIHIFGNKIQNVAISSPKLGVKHGKYTPLITGLHSFTLYRR